MTDNNEPKWYRATWQQTLLAEPTDKDWLDEECDLLATSAINAMYIMQEDILVDASTDGVLIKNLQVKYRGSFDQYQVHELNIDQKTTALIF